MPCNVRNWWIEGEVDGKKHFVALGPQAKDGGFELTITQRDRGGVIQMLSVWGVVSEEWLRLSVSIRGKNVIVLKTKR